MVSSVICMIDFWLKDLEQGAHSVVRKVFAMRLCGSVARCRERSGRSEAGLLWRLIGHSPVGNWRVCAAVAAQWTHCMTSAGGPPQALPERADPRVPSCVGL